MRSYMIGKGKLMERALNTIGSDPECQLQKESGTHAVLTPVPSSHCLFGCHIHFGYTHDRQKFPIKIHPLTCLDQTQPRTKFASPIHLTCMFFGLDEETRSMPTQDPDMTHLATMDVVLICKLAQDAGGGQGFRNVQTDIAGS